jgi:thiosulfate/3-mercaptopyruvate sulfurtransferase
VTIRDTQAITNVFATEEQFHRYAMTPADWMRLEDEADAKGLTLVGYYHSHPDHPAIPSEYDRVHALPNFRYLITSVRGGQAAEMRAWQLSEDRSQFEELALSVPVSDFAEASRGEVHMSNTAAHPEVLVTTDWAIANLTAPNTRFVEVDVDTTQYAQGHLPGAVAFNWQSQLQDQVARDILSKEQFEALASEAGITPSATVILYGDNNNWFAAYALWLFKYYGHPDVRLIDGGRKKLVAEGRALTTDVPHYPPTAYKVAAINADLRADRDYVKTRLGKGEFRLIDVRSPAEFVGDIIAPPGMTETAQRAGHIPSAKNVPWSTAVREDGTFKSLEELNAIYGGKGIAQDSDAVAYCRIGERSSHTWFVLKYLLGVQNVRNYDGSWTEWGNLIGAPIAKGAE